MINFWLGCKSLQKNFRNKDKTITLKILSAIKDIEEIWIQA